MSRHAPLLLLALMACTPNQRSAPPMDATALIQREAVPMAVLTAAGDPALQAFGREASRVPIVLLGENGHGVREHSLLKVEMVKYLHEHHGLDVIAFESGFHECGTAEAKIGSERASETLRRCLLTQFHHVENVPLFEYIAATHKTSRPLRLAGIDMQVQSFYSRTRPQYFRKGLELLGYALADTIAILDSTLIEKSFTPADTLRAWLYPHLPATKRLFESAANVAAGDLQWSLLAVVALLERETLRSAALAAGTPIPARFYEIRDEYMARSVLRHTAGGRRVAVWLHNDHARYGNFAFGELPIRSTGGYLREMAPGRTYSVGFLTGGGTVANNSRRPMQVAPADSGSLEWHFKQLQRPAAWLSLTANGRVRSWAQQELRYSRGNEVLRMRPGQEFDALVYVDSVGVPGYRVP